MRSTRSEVLSLATALALPVAVFCTLPYSSSPELKKMSHSSSDGFASFVTLTPQQEEQIMKRTKTTHVGNAARNERKLDLILGVLPDDEPQPLLQTQEIAPVRNLAVPPFRFNAYAPTCAAPKPEVLKAEPEKLKPAFSFDDMVKTD